jgi:hypothetical protein
MSNLWSRQSKLYATDGINYDYFGSAVSTYGNIAMIGTYSDDYKAIDGGTLI